MERSRNGRTTETRPASPEEAGRAKQRAFCIAASPETVDLEELKELLRTAGVATVGELTQKRDAVHPNTYLGSGKVAEVKAALKEADANVVVADDELTPRQQRNLESELDVPVLDRTSVILDIFASHAHTAEGKMQVELAQLEYNMARMRGLWTHLERLGAGRGVGGIGTRGPGESQIETDRRLARDRITVLRRRLEDVKATRATQRAERERAHLPNVALAGYTNAGKSTLLNALTGSDVGVRDRLFHTLDPTTRTLKLHGRTFLFTDTVGFIRKLPHGLVNAFAATLEETKLADMVLHVVDASTDEDELVEMTRAVEDVLEEIDAGSSPRMLVLNKADILDDERRRELSFRHPDAVLVSAQTGEGLEELQERIHIEFEKTLVDIELLVPYNQGALLHEIHEIAGELDREDRPEGVKVAARLPKVVAERYGRYALNGQPSGD
ncbi:GTPase HflX [Solirubrobacter taibaiensis]|nr:GTPase HflX [Solirubrobacter taibaiensis]